MPKVRLLSNARLHSSQNHMGEAGEVVELDKIEAEALVVQGQAVMVEEVKAQGGPVEGKALHVVGEHGPETLVVKSKKEASK